MRDSTEVAMNDASQTDAAMKAPPVEPKATAPSEAPIDALNDTTTAPPVETKATVSSEAPIDALNDATTVPPVETKAMASSEIPIDALNDATTAPKSEAPIGALNGTTTAPIDAPSEMPTQGSPPSVADSPPPADDPPKPPPTILVPGRGALTHEAALETDANIVGEVAHWKATRRFFDKLWHYRGLMRALVVHHLDLPRRADVTIAVATHHTWLLGGFNVCIPVKVELPGQATRRFMMRFAIPHKLAEPKYPGTVNEKVASEVGAYVWMQEMCPDIPIPRLYGFGFLGGGCVSTAPFSLTPFPSLPLLSPFTSPRSPAD